MNVNNKLDCDKIAEIIEQVKKLTDWLKRLVYGSDIYNIKILQQIHSVHQFVHQPEKNYFG